MTTFMTPSCLIGVDINHPSLKHPSLKAGNGPAAFAGARPRFTDKKELILEKVGRQLKWMVESLVAEYRQGALTGFSLCETGLWPWPRWEPQSIFWSTPISFGSFWLGFRLWSNDCDKARRPSQIAPGLRLS
jgi:hypothetical protein